jgi:hypothetical protein
LLVVWEGEVILVGDLGREGRVVGAPDHRDG